MGELPGASERWKLEEKQKQLETVMRVAERRKSLDTNTTLFHRLHILLSRTQGFSFKGADVLALQQPCVYLWMRRDDVLYIGMSEGGAERPFSPRHKTLRIEPSDALWIWPVASVEEANETELMLIEAFSPPFNKRRTYTQHLLMEKLGVSRTQAKKLIVGLSSR